MICPRHREGCGSTVDRVDQFVKGVEWARYLRLTKRNIRAKQTAYLDDVMLTSTWLINCLDNRYAGDFDVGAGC